MESPFFPKIAGSRARAFFTSKEHGADLRRIAEIAKIDKHKIYLPVQRHTDKVLVLDSLEPKIGDAVITDRDDILIGVQVADCVPILLYDRRVRVVGAVHAGWRGTAAEILKKTIRTMEERFASSPSDIVVAIGPGIRWCCYTVGHEVIEGVKKATGEGDYSVIRGEKNYIDLPSANRCQAVSRGVLPENIWMSDDCTFCLPEKYYSYRFAKGPTGRQGGFIGII